MCHKRKAPEVDYSTASKSSKTPFKKLKNAELGQFLVLVDIDAVDSFEGGGTHVSHPL
jgi:hypothetical protein